MGLQGAIGRSLDVPGVMTVIFTSTYTAIVGGALNGEKLIAHRACSAADIGACCLSWRCRSCWRYHTLAAGRAFPSFNNGFDAARSITAVPDSFSDLIVLGLFLPYAPVF